MQKELNNVVFRNVSLDDRLHQVSAFFAAGECWHILGQNGAGKSTLFDLIAGLIAPAQGQLNVGEMQADDNLRLATFRTYLQQDCSLAFDLSAIELLQFYVDWPKDYWQNLDSSTSCSTLPKDIEHAFDVERLLNKRVSCLSGGELQRLQVTRALLQIWPALIQGSGIVLLDEPLQALDVAFQAACLEFLQRLAKRGNTIILSVHDVNVPLQYASHVLMLKQGEVFASGPCRQQMTSENLSRLYDYPFTEFNDVNNSEKLFVRSPNTERL
ncbi:ABC transporter ATP-binding protein [Glaciecola sp. MH2013]|uniref:ABC transporter ATP-binding protein n=1 Tax=Glaciecola sp. MH2013 TaxID=2785524 RepID=UPI00189C85A6|nr:ABC transporter ATP-binding protein [Glaciecola sp. MH2013]MBF7073166.1 ABC transporter ATP-binding protein [Glaciecola sp. MH2013]